MLAKPETSGLVAFYSAIKRRDVHMGAVLEIDAMGLPVAFHHTNPVRPGGLARLLLGPKDDSHTRARVLLPPLMEALKVKPALLLVLDRATFEGIEPEHLGVPVLLIADGTGDPMPSPGDQEKLEDGGLKIQVYDVGPPLVFHGVDPAKQVDLLIKVAQHSELLEPFHRVDQALQTLFDQEAREGQG